MTEFKVGDRVVATDRIDEEGVVRAGDEGVIVSARPHSTLYPYSVMWDNDEYSSLIGDYEIDPVPVTIDLSQCVLKSDLEKVFDDWFFGTWRDPDTDFNKKLKEHGISFDPPKKRWRVSYEVERGEKPEEIVTLLEGTDASTIRVEEI